MPGTWHQQTIETSTFPLRVALKVSRANAPTLTIYIEGDGHAWVDRHTISPDPTPKQPTVLQMAQHDPHGKVAYIARPCQYVMSTNCHYRYWTYARFSEPVITALNQAIDQLKQKSVATDIELVGFSGGGGLALLLAARRSDVTQVITVAGNINTDTWTRFHHLSPLQDSYNPATALTQLPERIRLCLLYGDRDKVFPPQLIARFRTLVNRTRPGARFVTVPGIGHRWPAENVRRRCTATGQPPAHTN